MNRAAEDGTAGWWPALAAECANDPVTLKRVAAALLGQLGGTMPAAPAPLIGPAGYLARRTATPPFSQVRRDAG